MPKRMLLIFSLLAACLSCADYLSLWTDTRLEMLAHFKLQFSLVLAALMVCLYLAQKKLAARIALTVVMFNLLQMGLWYLPLMARANASPTTRAFSVLQANVYFHNQDSQHLAHVIHSQNPDIVILQEANPKHVQKMEEMRLQYPYVLRSPKELKIGLGIWSRYPIANGSFRLLDGNELPALSGEFLMGNQSFEFLTTHLTSPLRKSVTTRNQQLQALGAYLQEHPQTQLLLGDFNISMWSPQYKNLEKQTGLSNCRRGFGLLPSWPAQMPEWARIPIDQCLVGNEMQVQKMQILEDIGSDHLPLLTRFSILK